MRPCRHDPTYPHCSCGPVSCVLLRSTANPAGLEKWDANQGLGARGRAWSDDEPKEAPDTPRKPARFYAPPGDCPFCDERRRAAAASMRTVREKGRGE